MDVLEAALYLLGRGKNEVGLEELFDLLERLNFEGSVLEGLEKLQKEGLVELKGGKVVITDYGLAQFSKEFARMLDREPEKALALLRARYFRNAGRT